MYICIANPVCYVSIILSNRRVTIDYLPAIDYLASSHLGHVVFRPLTPRAVAAFDGLGLDTEGCFWAADEDEANALFARLDEADLVDLTV